MKEKDFCITEIIIRQNFIGGDKNEVSVSSNKIHIGDFKEQLMRACLAIGWTEKQVESIFSDET